MHPMRPMRHARPVLAALLVLSGTPLLAQNSQCGTLSSADNSRQTCDAALDLTRAYHPIAGLLISGGNPLLGSAASMGGLGKFAISLRANAARIVIPDLAVDASNNVARSDELLAPAPLLEGAIGLFKGLPNGMLSLDVLGSAQLVPNEKLVSDIRVDPDAPRVGPVSLGLGYGGRLGLFGGSGVLPGVSVSVMRRSTPEVGFGDLAAGDDIAADVNLHATNIRVVASKRWAILTLAAGAGWSRYTGDAVASFRASPSSVPQSISLHLDQRRKVIFADAGFDFRFLRIVGEIGHQSGRDQQLITNFQGFDDTKGTTFYSAGLRFGF
jgi:hypothetical protein